MEKNYKKHIEEFYQATLENFELETTFLQEGPYKDSPMVIIFPYTKEEIGHPGYNTYRIDVDCHSDNFWFSYKNNHFVTEIDIKTSQYAVLKSIKDIQKMTNIIKELLPEKRYKEVFPDYTKN